MMCSRPMDRGALQQPMPRPVHGIRVSLQALLLVALVMPQIVISMCPNRCSGRGDCNPFGRCECWSGWGGGDCSQRACTTGLAWSDEATATDTAHGTVECSNRGVCDRATGRCKCMSGFSGAACERNNCPRGCSGHGHCISMATYSEDYRGAESVQYTYNDVWDGHKLYGCLCDSGFHGFDCSLHECPRGDDPLTTGQVNEIQLLVCEARAGSFVLYYEGYATPTIPHDASEVYVEDALSSIPVIQQGVDVEFSLDHSGACNSTAINVIQVEFLGNFGPLRPMWSYSSLTPGDVAGLTIAADGSSIYDSDGVGYESIKGSKENVECSNRGICGTQEGICECFTSNDDIFASSDGYNGPGTRGDCGFQVTKTAGCPGEIACSGHGTCNEDTFTCDCNHGWTAGDCSQRTCPYGLSWFSYPSAEGKAHDERTECSDGGLCNRETGMCECGDLFHGSACEYSVCPGGITNACHGRGRCMSMAELALVAENNGDATDLTYGSDANKGSTWDAHRMFGCHCDYGYAGYDCSERVCPTGDDPGSWGQESEVQTITCQATNGTFTLRFRQEETVPISSDATSAELRNALEDLDTLDVVLVSFALRPETTVCQNDGSGVASVTFITQHGDVPLLSTDASNLIDDADGGAPGSGNIAVSEWIKGSTEEETCSNRGLCDAGTGKCLCFSGWASSDGAGGIGDRGDCGYRVPMTTHLRGGSRAGEANMPTTALGYTARGRQSAQEANQNSFRGISHVDDSLARRKETLLAAHQH